MRFWHLLLRCLATLIGLLVFAWVAMALSYQLPGGTVVRGLGIAAWSAVGVASLVLLWRGRAGKAAAVTLGALAVFWIWWRGIEPSDARDWADDVARHVQSAVDGDRVTLTNVRNFAWTTDHHYEARWETRQYDLRLIRSVDVICSYWMGPAIAHTLVSFGFADGQYVTFSIEIRKEREETFSAIGGFFKMFETTLIAADERDILWVRTNARAEDVYVYRIANIRPEEMRALFMGYLAQGQELIEAPRWYHTVTGNCTTMVYAIARVVVKALPIDYRLLVSGYLPDYLFDQGALTPGFDLETLRTRGHINERARMESGDPAFSTRIREGIPGTP